MKTYLYIILVLLIAMTSCQKVVDADKLLGADEKVYIVGFLSPNDTVFRVNVSKALPAVGTPLPANNYEAFRDEFLIKDATVQISDAAGNSTNLMYVDSLETYLADASSLTIESEQQYFLEVVVGNETYNANCTIPKKINDIETEFFLSTDSFNNQDGNIKLRFQDFSDEKNFYMLGGYYTVNYTFEDEEPSEFTNGIYYDTDQFLTDNISDGGFLGGNGKLYVSIGAEINSAIATIQVAHMEEIIFQYMRTDELNFDAEGNPFVEYAIEPNNFIYEGAVGVFAGYQITEKEFDLGL